MPMESQKSKRPFISKSIIILIILFLRNESVRLEPQHSMPIIELNYQNSLLKPRNKPKIITLKTNSEIMPKIKFTNSGDSISVIDYRCKLIRD